MTYIRPVRVQSADDLDAAIVWAGANPKNRWYVARMAARFDKSDLIPSDWDVRANPAAPRRIASEQDLVDSAMIDQAVRNNEVPTTEAPIPDPKTNPAPVPPPGQQPVTAAIGKRRKTQKIQTQAGVKRYGAPIGTPIVRKNGKLVADVTKAVRVDRDNSIAGPQLPKNRVRASSVADLEEGDEISMKDGTELVIISNEQVGGKHKLVASDVDGKEHHFDAPATAKIRLIEDTTEPGDDDPDAPTQETFTPRQVAEYEAQFRAGEDELKREKITPEELAERKEKWESARDALVRQEGTPDGEPDPTPAPAEKKTPEPEPEGEIAEPPVDKPATDETAADPRASLRKKLEKRLAADPDNAEIKRALASMDGDGNGMGMFAPAPKSPPKSDTPDPASKPTGRVPDADRDRLKTARDASQKKVEDAQAKFRAARDAAEKFDVFTGSVEAAQARYDMVQAQREHLEAARDHDVLLGEQNTGARWDDAKRAQWTERYRVNKISLGERKTSLKLAEEHAAKVAEAKANKVAEPKSGFDRTTLTKFFDGTRGRNRGESIAFSDKGVRLGIKMDVPGETSTFPNARANNAPYILQGGMSITEVDETLTKQKAAAAKPAAKKAAPSGIPAGYKAETSDNFTGKTLAEHQRRVAAREAESARKLTKLKADRATATEPTPDTSQKAAPALDLSGKTDSRGNPVSATTQYRVGRGGKLWLVDSVNADGTFRLKAAEPSGQRDVRTSVAADRLVDPATPAAPKKRGRPKKAAAAEPAVATVDNAALSALSKDADGNALTTDGQYMVGTARGTRMWQIEKINDDGTLQLAPVGGGPRRRHNIDPAKLKLQVDSDGDGKIDTPAEKKAKRKALREQQRAQLDAATTKSSLTPNKPKGDKAAATKALQYDLDVLKEQHKALFDAEQELVTARRINAWGEERAALQVKIDTARKNYLMAKSDVKRSRRLAAEFGVDLPDPPAPELPRVSPPSKRVRAPRAAPSLPKVSAGSSTDPLYYKGLSDSDLWAEQRGAEANGNADALAAIKAEDLRREEEQFGPQLATKSDAQLLDMLDAAGARSDSAQIEQIMKELDRREQDENAANSDDVWERISNRVRQGENPLQAEADETGANIDTIVRRESLTYLKQNFAGINTNRYEEALSQAYREAVRDDISKAEAIVRGAQFVNLLGRQRGITAQDLWTQNLRTATRYATPEVKEHWDTHGRITKQSFRDRILTAIGAPGAGNGQHTSGAAGGFLQ